MAHMRITYRQNRIIFLQFAMGKLHLDSNVDGGILFWKSIVGGENLGKYRKVILFLSHSDIQFSNYTIGHFFILSIKSDRNGAIHSIQFILIKMATPDRGIAYNFYKRTDT